MATGEELFQACKVSLEDYQSQTGDRITKKLVKEVVQQLAGQKLSPSDFKEVVSELQQIFVGG
jgi:hypothetical protein